MIDLRADLDSASGSAPRIARTTVVGSTNLLAESKCKVIIWPATNEPHRTSWDGNSTDVGGGGRAEDRRETSEDPRGNLPARTSRGIHRAIVSGSALVRGTRTLQPLRLASRSLSVLRGWQKLARGVPRYVFSPRSVRSCSAVYSTGSRTRALVSSVLMRLGLELLNYLAPVV